MFFARRKSTRTLGLAANKFVDRNAKSFLALSVLNGNVYIDVTTMNSEFPNFLAPPIIEQLKLVGIPSLTSIQSELFPPVMEGKSVLAHSKTGTGKTLAYLLPLVQRAFFAHSAEGETSSGLSLTKPKDPCFGSHSRAGDSG